MEAWERSKQDSEIQRLEFEIGPDGKLRPSPTKAVVEKQHRDGNPAFLKVMMLVEDMEARILGTYSATTTALEVSTEAKPRADLEALRAAFRKRIIAEIKNSGEALNALVPSALKNQ